MGIGLGFAAVLLGALVAIATRPKTFRVQRSIEIAAPQEAVFGYLVDFHRWASWSPFEKLDPSMKKTFEGASSGVGAIYRWSGNAKAGQGSMTIRESIPPRRLLIALAFDKPMKTVSTTEFSLESTARGVQLTWATYGDNTLLGKAFSLVVDMDKMLGKDFEAGLQALKTLAEQRASPAPSPGTAV